MIPWLRMAFLYHTGCLALRAAAFEPRVKRVVAYDVCFDVFDLRMKTLNPAQRLVVRMLLDVHASRVFNAIVQRAQRQNAAQDWSIRQGMHVMGAQSPYDLMKRFRQFTTRDVSPLVKQDALLLAGTRDHAIPLAHFYRQIEALTNVWSLTARLFTEAETAHNHCQVGNVGLALAVITDWLDHLLTASKATRSASP